MEYPKPKLINVGRCISIYTGYKKIRAKVIINKDICKIHGVGVKGYDYRKNIIINAQNSGTLGRLISEF